MAWRVWLWLALAPVVTAQHPVDAKVKAAIGALDDPFEFARASRVLVKRFDRAQGPLLDALSTHRGPQAAEVLKRGGRWTPEVRARVLRWLSLDRPPTAGELRATVALGLAQPVAEREAIAERLVRRATRDQDRLESQQEAPKAIEIDGGTIQASGPPDPLGLSVVLDIHAAAKELRLGRSPSAQVLVEALTAVTIDRRAAIRRLDDVERIDDPELIEALTSIVQKGSMPEQLTLARQLMLREGLSVRSLALGSARVMLRSAYRRDRLRVVFWLRTHGAVARELLPELIPMLDTADDRLLAELLVTLTIAGIPPRSEWPPTRAEAMRELRTVKDPAEASRLRRALERQPGERELLPAIERLTRHVEPQVARRAAAALQRLRQAADG